VVVRWISREEFTPSWAIVGGEVGENVKSGSIDQPFVVERCDGRVIVEVCKRGK
jgi:hypothetical protein